MSELVIEGLTASVGDKQILDGVDLVVRSGEVHAVMGPNGSGKSTLSHVLMGRHGYEVTGGNVTLDGVDLLALPTWQRAAAGLFLAFQYPTEVPGVALGEMLGEALSAAGRDAAAVGESLAVEADRLGFDPSLIDRPLNVDLSGGEKKRNDTLQMSVLAPRIAVLDEIDSGLDVDALRAVSKRIEDATRDGLEGGPPLGVLAITHYTRLLEELRADRVHIFVAGRIVESGGPELADRLEVEGYAAWTDGMAVDEGDSEPERPVIDDPFADPLL
ncbi:MAG: Fe-S cluster assembly ATPase SufC [Actinomycetia bacterium]|nr:Fe-S cluster assembly ATPase SufC [Actinomycetes bacterium]